MLPFPDVKHPVAVMECLLAYFLNLMNAVDYPSGWRYLWSFENRSPLLISIFVLRNVFHFFFLFLAAYGHMEFLSHSCNLHWSCCNDRSCIPGLQSCHLSYCTTGRTFRNFLNILILIFNKTHFVICLKLLGSNFDIKWSEMSGWHMSV